MNVYEMTGYFRGGFVNENEKGRVMNFYVQAKGYKSEQGYVNKEYSFECWHHSVIEKLRHAPYGAVVSVEFSIIPKKLTIEGGKKANVHSLNVNHVTIWKTENKEGEGKKDEKVRQIDFAELIDE